MSIILETNDLTYTYPDGTKALNGINIKVNKGEMLTFWTKWLCKNNTFFTF